MMKLLLEKALQKLQTRPGMRILQNRGALWNASGAF